MKQEQYLEAITCYTKAIDLNPSNAVYYCNRYSELKLIFYSVLINSV